jgi:putative transposase
MSHSLVKDYTHIVFSTKLQNPFLISPLEDELYRYMSGICKNLDCQPVAVGGNLDHVHILCVHSKKITLIKLIEEIKSHSSKWVKTKSYGFADFYWQSGYGSFSVCPCCIDRISNYIRRQHEHHKKMTFREEYLKILKKYNVEYDERYLWD